MNNKATNSCVFSNSGEPTYRNSGNSATINIENGNRSPGTTLGLITWNGGNSDFACMDGFLGPFTKFRMKLPSGCSFDLEIEPVVTAGSDNSSGPVVPIYTAVKGQGSREEQELIIDNGECQIKVINYKTPCCSSSNRVFRVYIPGKDEFIGTIDTNGALDLETNSIINITGSPVQYLMHKYQDSESPFSFAITNFSTNETAGVGMASRWKTTINTVYGIPVAKTKDLKEFTFYLKDMDTQTNLVLFAAFVLLMYDREKSPAQKIFTSFFALLIAGGLFYWYISSRVS